MTLESVGRYDIIEKIGGGGMADVYLAHDPQMRRDVAVKVIRREFVGDEGFVTRFEREAQIVAALEYDGIVPVYDYGEQDGLPFLVMRFMTGGTLADRIEHEPLAGPEVISLFNRIAPALDLAHSRGLVHRDLKPENILFDNAGNASIADFGIAKIIDTPSQLTDSGSIVGTPAYMSPEQIHGKGDIDHLSDLYSLGVILYECLTGQIPFIVDSKMAIFSAHLNDPVPDIRDVRPDLPPAFSSIIYRAMAKEKGVRYQSAAELAADVDRAFDSEYFYDEFDTVVVDTSPSRRLPLALMGAGVLGLVLIGVLLSGVLKPSEPEPVVVRVTATGEAVLPVSDAPTPTIDPAEPSAPLARLARGDSFIVFESSRDAFPLRDIYVMRPDESYQARLTVNDVDDYEPSWSPDGSHIVFVSGRDGNPEIYTMDFYGLDVVRLTDDQAIDGHPDWSPDGSRIVFTSNRDGNSEIYVMDVDGQNVQRLTEHSGRDEEPVWSPDGTQIAYISERDGPREVYVMNADGSDSTRVTYSVGLSSLRRAQAPAWDPTGTRIAFISDRTDPNGAVYVWDIEQGTESAALGNSAEEIPLSLNGLHSLTWSPDGSWIMVSGKTASGAIADRPLVVSTLDGSSTVLLGVDNHVNYNPDWWAPPSADQETESKTSPADALLAELAGQGHILFNSNLIDLSSTEDFGRGDIFVVDADGRDRKQLTIDGAHDCCAVWSPDGIEIAFASNRHADDDLFDWGNMAIYIMDANGSNVALLIDNPGADMPVAWSPDGEYILFQNNDDVYTINRENLQMLNLTGDGQTNLDFPTDWSPDGSQILFTSYSAGSGDIYLIDVDGSNRKRITFDTTANEVMGTWSPDGSRIAYAYQKWNPDVRTTLFIHELESRNDIPVTSEMALLVEPTVFYSFGGLTWSPNGQYIAYSACFPQQVSCRLSVVSLTTLEEIRLVSNNAESPDWRPTFDN